MSAYVIGEIEVTDPAVYDGYRKQVLATITKYGGRPDEPLCGGKVCPAGQFCCGPPACGRCAYPMAGPRCPSVCSGQKSN